MAAEKLRYFTRSEGPLECSHCERPATVLVRLPLKGLRVRGLAGILSHEDPFIAWCERCVRDLLSGFAEAADRALGSEDETPPTKRK